MVMSSLLPNDPQVQKEGSGTWKTLSSIQPPPFPPKTPVSLPGKALTDADVKPWSQPVPTRSPKKSNYGCLWGILVLLGIGFVSYVSKQNSPPSYSSSPQPSSDHAPTQPAYQAPPQTYALTGGDGKTYLVSNENYQILSTQKQKLDDSLTYLNAQQNGLAMRKRQLERDRLSLDNTDQNAVDGFNLEVQSYNSSADDVQKELDAYNAQVDAFNAELERVGTPQN